MGMENLLIKIYPLQYKFSYPLNLMSTLVLTKFYCLIIYIYIHPFGRKQFRSRVGTLNKREERISKTAKRYVHFISSYEESKILFWTTQKMYI